MPKQEKPYQEPERSFSDNIHKQIIGSLDGVGATKAVGYLPLSTIERVLEQNLGKLAQQYRERGLRVRVFEQDETCIRSGALFVWDHNRACRCIVEFCGAVKEKGWPIDVDVVLENIAAEWFENDDSIMPLIRALYDED